MRTALYRIPYVQSGTSHTRDFVFGRRPLFSQEIALLCFRLLSPYRRIEKSNGEEEKGEAIMVMTTDGEETR